uniref:Uncharacterized protein n=1 Tax=Arundo donax TaxID=35708 RepID=A0A0A9A099_ARUDO
MYVCIPFAFFIRHQISAFFICVSFSRMSYFVFSQI